MRRTLLLNVGMDIGSTESLSAHVIKEILVANGLLLGREKIVRSDTEKTLVIEASPGIEVNTPARMRAAIYLSATDLRQECIAAYSPAAERGALVGPNAAAWGDFNPEFFFNLDGQRLTAAVTQ